MNKLFDPRAMLSTFIIYATIIAFNEVANYARAYTH